MDTGELFPIELPPNPVPGLFDDQEGELAAPRPKIERKRERKPTKRIVGDGANVLIERKFTEGTPETGFQLGVVGGDMTE